MFAWQTDRASRHRPATGINQVELSPRPDKPRLNESAPHIPSISTSIVNQRSLRCPARRHILDATVSAADLKLNLSRFRRQALGEFFFADFSRRRIGGAAPRRSGRPTRRSVSPHRHQSGEPCRSAKGWRIYRRPVSPRKGGNLTHRVRTSRTSIGRRVTALGDQRPDPGEHKRIAEPLRLHNPLT